MKVLEDEHERQLAADGLERLEHLPEHPLVGCADQAAVDGLELVVGEEPRHLCDPRRRLPSEQWDERPPAGLASESAECSPAHGQVGLAGATVLGALAVRDQAVAALPTRASSGRFIVLPIPASPVATKRRHR